LKLDINQWVVDSLEISRYWTLGLMGSGLFGDYWGLELEINGFWNFGD
jgi:hypothetical protein